MSFVSVVNENLMIGTAVLATYSDKKHKDSIDIMLPFVKYTLHEKYSLNSKIFAVEICDYIQEKFYFQNLPIAIINKSLNRLSKNGGCLSYNNGEYFFIKEVEEEHSRIKTKRLQATELIESIVSKLTPYVNSRVTFRRYTEEEVKKSLFNFLDKYGLTTFENRLKETSMAKTEQLNRIIGGFILDEYEHQSSVFNKLIELIKGVFLSKAIYLQTNNDNLFKSRMKDTVLILDAPLMLRMLGLKTEGENRTAKEFAQVIPSQVRLQYFQQNFEELERIIRSYKYQKISGGRINAHTIEYFDEKEYSVVEIEHYYIQLEKKLRSLGIYKFDKEISTETNYKINEDELSVFLKEKIPSYVQNERALETDVTTIANIFKIRKGQKASSIENCKVIFITNNANLVNCVNNFFSDNDTIGCAMTEIDFTILMWLKNGGKNNDVPKDMLVANAMAATEEITENFMTVVLSKIRHYQEEGTFDEENVGLILEDIYCRREIVDRCNGDPDNFSLDMYKSVKEKYENSIINKANINNVQLKNDLEEMKRKNTQAEKERSEIIDRIIKEAKDKANTNKKIGKVLLIGIFLAVVIFLLISGGWATIKTAIDGSINFYGIIALLFALAGVVSLILEKAGKGLKLIEKLTQCIYDKTYEKKTRILKNKT